MDPSPFPMALHDLLVVLGVAEATGAHRHLTPWQAVSLLGVPQKWCDKLLQLQDDMLWVKPFVYYHQNLQKKKKVTWCPHHPPACSCAGRRDLRMETAPKNVSRIIAGLDSSSQTGPRTDSQATLAAQTWAETLSFLIFEQVISDSKTMENNGEHLSKEVWKF